MAIPFSQAPSPAHSPYILSLRKTEVVAVGPFETYDAACAWGEDPANNPADNVLSDSAANPHVMSAAIGVRPSRQSA